MTCWCCGLWLELEEWTGEVPEFCPACGEPTSGRDDDNPHGGCGDDECALHTGHCLLEEPRYRPDECDYCREAL